MQSIAQRGGHLCSLDALFVVTEIIIMLVWYMQVGLPEDLHVLGRARCPQSLCLRPHLRQADPAANRRLRACASPRFVDLL